MGCRAPWATQRRAPSWRLVRHGARIGRCGATWPKSEAGSRTASGWARPNRCWIGWRITSGGCGTCWGRGSPRLAGRRRSEWGEGSGAVRRDGDGVLEVRRQAAVGRHHGPLVAQGAGGRIADGDHRLDGERHPLEQTRPPLGTSVVRHLRLLVEPGADPVAHQLAYHPEPGRLGYLLNRVPDVAHVVAHPRLSNAGRQALPGHRE